MDSFSLTSLINKGHFSNLYHEITTSLVYYGNACKICFKIAELTCSSCKLVPYCSRNHEDQDLPFHKSICTALTTIHKKLKCIPHCAFEDFTQYRKNLAFELKKKLDYLSMFERQICEFPWVCVTCYSRENLNFTCEECNAVVYCCLEHKEKDAEQHESNCKNLKLCRIFDSIPYENGFGFIMQKFTFQEIPRSIKNFPKNIDELSSLIQNQLKKKNNELNDIVNYYKYNDIYAPAATILYALVKIGLLDGRVLTTAPCLTKQQRENRLTDRVAQKLALKCGKIQKFESEPVMIIHIVAASEYEVFFQWAGFITILIHWMTNVDYMQIFVVGPTLKKFQKPDYSALMVYSEVQSHPKYYKEVAKKLPKPDLVVLYNYGRHKGSSKEFDERDSLRALFKHKNIPLVVTSTNETTLNNFVDKLKDLPNINVQVDTHDNPFAEARPHRIWEKECLTTYSSNGFIAVLTRS